MQNTTFLKITFGKLTDFLPTRQTSYEGGRNTVLCFLFLIIKDVSLYKTECYMKTEQVKLTKLKVNSENPRTITKDKFEKLINSILVFPRMLEIRPIVVDGDYTALGGNQRTEALKAIAKMEITTIAERLTDVSDFQRMSKAEQEDLIRYWDAWLLGDKKVSVIKADELTEDERKQFIIKDNAGFGDWDWDMLANSWDADLLTDWGLDLPTDWDTTEEETREASEDDFTEEDAANAETRVKAGEIWQLGEHRLMCGDSTKKEDVERLMNGEKADMVFTDPPYGVSYTGGVIHGNKINTDHKREMLKNDDVDIYSKFIPLLQEIINDGAIYIFYATCNSYELLKPLRDNNIELNSIIVWNKINTGYADMNSNYKNKYEPCVYCKRKGHKLNFVGPTNECTVWDIQKDRDNKFHPTQKPIDVPARAIKNSSLEGNIVVDLFGGSGSTLIACEQLNRRCRTMELDEHYCDVIIARWEKLTGKEAVKIYG